MKLGNVQKKVGVSVGKTGPHRGTQFSPDPGRLRELPTWGVGGTTPCRGPGRRYNPVTTQLSQHLVIRPFAPRVPRSRGSLDLVLIRVEALTFPLNLMRDSPIPIYSV